MTNKSERRGTIIAFVDLAWRDENAITVLAVATRRENDNPFRALIHHVRCAESRHLNPSLLRSTGDSTFTTFHGRFRISVSREDTTVRKSQDSIRVRLLRKPRDYKNSRKRNTRRSLKSVQARHVESAENAWRTLHLATVPRGRRELIEFRAIRAAGELLYTESAPERAAVALRAVTKRRHFVWRPQ